MVVTREEREELKKLSLAAFGVESRWRKILRTGLRYKDAGGYTRVLHMDVEKVKEYMNETIRQKTELIKELQQHEKEGSKT